MNRILALTIALLFFAAPCFAESNSAAVGYASDTEIKSGSRPENRALGIYKTSLDDIDFSAGTAEISTDVVFGYGNKPNITFKADGKILDSNGNEIATDIELLQKLRDALNGNCR